MERRSEVDTALYDTNTFYGTLDFLTRAGCIIKNIYCNRLESRKGNKERMKKFLFLASLVSKIKIKKKKECSKSIVEC